MTSELVTLSARKPPASTLRLVLTLTCLAALSGALIASVVALTAAKIAANKQTAVQKAVGQVLVGAEQVRPLRKTEEGISFQEPHGKEPTDYYAGYGVGGEFLGVALTATGRGYAGPVRVMFGYSPMSDKILGMHVLESKETPGLGDQIEKNEQFKKAFQGLSIFPQPSDGPVSPLPKVVKGQAQEEGEISAITGATISSKAVGAALRQVAEEDLFRLKRSAQQLAHGARE